MLTVVIVVVLALLALLAFDAFFPATAARLGIGLERWRSGLSLRQGEADGLSMPYLEGGAGEALVLLHGFGADKDNFTYAARHLTPRFRVVIPDLPGFGDAGRDLTASYRIPDQVRRLHEFLHGLGIERCHLGGSSMGGQIALEYAALYPDEVQSLWLLAPAGTAAAYDTEPFHTYRSKGTSPLLLDRPGDIEALLRVAMQRRPFMPPSYRKILGRRGAADRSLHEKLIAQLVSGSPLLENHIESVPAPALIVWGEEDRLLNPKAAETVRRLLPNSEVVIMPGIGHLPMLESPRRAAADFKDFLSRRS